MRLLTAVSLGGALAEKLGTRRARGGERRARRAAPSHRGGGVAQDLVRGQAALGSQHRVHGRVDQPSRWVARARVCACVYMHVRKRVRTHVYACTHADMHTHHVQAQACMHMERSDQKPWKPHF